MNRDWRDELFVHSSYGELVRASLWSSGTRRRIANSLAIFLFISVGGYSIDKLLGTGWAKGADAVIFVRGWAAIGLSFGSAMLAFLIAGFTVFATVTDVRVFKALGTLQDKSEKAGDTSHLQKIFLVFMFDFWQFIVFLIICVILSFFFAQGAPVTSLIGWLTRDMPEIRNILIHLAVGLMGMSFIAVILITKSFIWNVYQSILISIALKSAELEKTDEDT